MSKNTKTPTDIKSIIDLMLGDAFREAIAACPEYQRMKAEDEAETHQILHGDGKGWPLGILKANSSGHRPQDTSQATGYETKKGVANG